MWRYGQCLTFTTTCALALASANAHHSYSEYDDKTMAEIEGTLERVALQNPHVHFFVKGVDANGKAITWDLESTSLNSLQRTKVPPELYRVGARVKFAGWPSRRSADRMYVLNMLAENGQEVLLFRTAEPRWTSTTLGFGAEEAQSFYQPGVASGSTSLFHVWASHLGNPNAAFSPKAPLALTDAAKQAVAAFDPINDRRRAAAPRKECRA